MRLIDADALKESLLETFDKAVEWYQETKLERAEQAVVTFAECLLRLKEQPTAEPKKGRWEKMEARGRVYRCNQCGNFLDFDGVNVGRGDANYCPNCGTKMEGDTDETD